MAFRTAPPDRIAVSGFGIGEFLLIAGMPFLLDLAVFIHLVPAGHALNMQELCLGEVLFDISEL